LNDVKGECKAHANLGAVHLSLANYINAVKCYQEQLERAMVKKPLFSIVTFLTGLLFAGGER